MGVLTNVEAKPMASGNSKPSNSWTTGIVVGVIVALVQVSYNQWFTRSGGNDDLVRVGTEVAAMRKQLDRIESRDFVSRTELDRTVTRLEDRLRDIERELQSRK